jgi:hypothetical protein
MPASPLLREVYKVYLARWGEPTRSKVFDGGTPALPRTDVLVWDAETPDGVTVLGTLGMADRPMDGVPHRAELQFAVRGVLSPRDYDRVTAFLASVSLYPLTNHCHLDWWHTMPYAGDIPMFPGFRTVLLHPKFAPDGIDEIATSEGLVKILYVVPLNAEEVRTRPLSALFGRWSTNNVDLFSARGRAPTN